NPLHVRSIAHVIWDPHFGQPTVEAFTRGGAPSPLNIAYSGVYHWWYTIRTNFRICNSIKDLLEAHIPPGGRLGQGIRVFMTINNLIHFQFGLALASLGAITSLVA
ncbi:hypothetical protein Godav_010294, partial [Gossypium davidsonii]|nr:hypothetical protein [Gossypium davidsonii]